MAARAQLGNCACRVTYIHSIFPGWKVCQMALVRTLPGLARLPLTHLPPGGNRGSSRSGFTINTGENRNVVLCGRTPEWEMIILGLSEKLGSRCGSDS